MNYVSRFLVIILLGSLGTAASFGQQDPRHVVLEKGRAVAGQDIKDGIYKLHVVDGARAVIGPEFCHFPTQDELYESVLKDQYKIDLIVDYIADVGDWDDVIEFANGYNGISRSAIQSKYGPDIFERAQQRAAHEFETKYRENDRKCKEWHEEVRKMLMSLPKTKPA